MKQTRKSTLKWRWDVTLYFLFQSVTEENSICVCVDFSTSLWKKVEYQDEQTCEICHALTVGRRQTIEMKCSGMLNCERTIKHFSFSIFIGVERSIKIRLWSRCCGALICYLPTDLQAIRNLFLFFLILDLILACTCGTLFFSFFGWVLMINEVIVFSFSPLY